MDYGEQIFENPDTHELIGVTTAARWHIRVCGLNADHLVQERRRRARHWQTIKGVPVKIKGDCVRVADLIENYREQVELMIPEIPPAPLI